MILAVGDIDIIKLFSLLLLFLRRNGTETIPPRFRQISPLRVVNTVQEAVTAASVCAYILI